MHAEFDLAPNLRARVATALSDADAAAAPPELARLQQRLAAVDQDVEQDGEARRLADVVVAWNVFRHFYPYASEARVDWDWLLVTSLADAGSAKTRADRARVLRKLVAALQDGHGNVVDPMNPARGTLPLVFRIVSRKLIVTATAIPDQVPIGAEVTAIDDVPAAARIADEMLLASGTPQWRRTVAERRMSSCVRATVRLAVIAAGESRSASVTCATGRPPEEPRPPSLTEIRPGTWYVDLTRAAWKEIAPLLPKLANADGIVFDVRGYPTDSGFNLLPFLVTQPDPDTWMHVPTIVGPFHQVGAWRSFSWNLQRGSPLLTSPLVVLTDGRAISYSESVLGHVADHKLATIIGGATAGANGNIARFAVPGQFMLTFTGMRVTGHDGARQHHLVGVKPDIELEPSVESIAAGRDELLERALAVLAAKRNP